MPDSDLTTWLQNRGFYSLLILVLVVLGLVLALNRRRRAARGRVRRNDLAQKSRITQSSSSKPRPPR